MKFCLCRLITVGLMAASPTMLAGEPPLIYSVVGPPTTTAAGATIDVQVAALNRATRGVAVNLPSNLDGTLAIDGTRSTVNATP